MALRDSLGLTQKQIADAVGVTNQIVSNCESGADVPQLTFRETVNLCKITTRNQKQKRFQIIQIIAAFISPMGNAGASAVMHYG
ncbi:MAG: helix-turn-helix domain-containing protein [Fischerella sp.]|nr:helix-turn-helix domain-containing protein [Fischerella sp.]